MNLNSYLDIIKSNFACSDRYEAHRKTASVVVEMAKDKSIWFEIVKKNLSQTSYLQKQRHHPIIAFEIEENADFSFIAHCYLPLPNREANISHQSIHHHGNLILTTVSSYGSGYESIIFKNDFKIDKNTGRTEMHIDKVYSNKSYNLEFIDTYTPHIVFFPSALSITYALWSNNKKLSTDKIKRNPILQKFKMPIIQILKKTGLASLIGINVMEYFDFYPHNGEILALKERIFGYTPGTNSNFIQNVLYILQQTGFEDYEFINKLRIKFSDDENLAVIKWIDLFLQKRPIQDLFETHHMGIDKVNINKKDVLSVFT
ncbi:MAG: hypothetical protein JKY33_07975 [Bacteroidia bacterium]|nr:hypothetical protein [Bacteroidia bacterium]